MAVSRDGAKHNKTLSRIPLASRSAPEVLQLPVRRKSEQRSTFVPKSDIFLNIFHSSLTNSIEPPEAPPPRPPAGAASPQDAGPAAAPRSGSIPVSPGGGGAAAHLPPMSSHRGILDADRHRGWGAVGGKRSRMHVLAHHIVSLQMRADNMLK